MKEYAALLHLVGNQVAASHSEQFVQNIINAHMKTMSDNGWRLVSTTWQSTHILLMFWAGGTG